MNFIKTSDLETRNKLISLGFEEIPNTQKGIFTFINNKQNFSDEVDSKKITYTSILCI